MSHPAWENPAEFLDPEEFGTVAVRTRSGHAPLEVLGIFDDPSLVAEAGDFAMDDLSPRFLVTDEVAAGIRHHDTLEIDGRSWVVVANPQRDGTGLSSVPLAPPTTAYAPV